MEPSDLNTHLPPRKRLLAGLRTAASALDAEPNLPSPAASADLAARLREMALAASSSPEEMIEAARAAAAAAADAATAARAAAAEKAAVAAKARASACAAMEFLESFSRTGGTSRNGLQFKVKSRKKHVQVKLLYKPNGRGGAVGDGSKPRRRRESDEDVARKLHRVMNSSPRSPQAGPKRRRSAVGDGKDGVASREVEGDACNGSSTHMPIEVGRLANGCSEGKPSERAVPLFKHEGRDDIGENSSRYSAKSSDITDSGVGIGNSSASRKVKIKKKELLVNPHSSKETGEPIETDPSPIHSVVDDESKSNGNGAEKRASPADAKSQSEPVKITSVWKFKKFKSSHCSSDSKVLHNVCSSPSAAETSASVKAD